jgi:hypothetical protein
LWLWRPGFDSRSSLFFVFSLFRWIGKRRAATGIEPVASRTQSENHTTRPSGLLERFFVKTNDCLMKSHEQGIFCAWKPPRSRGSMVERRTPDPKVAGSSPVVVTVFTLLSGSDLVVMMSALHAESRGFKPRLSYSFCKNRFGQD